MSRNELFYPPTKAQQGLEYVSIEESSLHPLVHRIMQEEEDFLPPSPSSSPRFSRRSNRRDLKKFRDTTSRRHPLRGPGSWSPEMSRTSSVRSGVMGYEGDACEDDKVVPSAPPMDLMDHFTGYEQLSFEAGMSSAASWLRR
ncbi:uncharacterized protein LOC135203494 [Macrobrachium nipponense]|uniref:uncharacterized protein LOC135203494 n=1 Tax=Macrobrachium nipponense TaxID=159736 RepID=UPI0030C88ED6